MGKAETSLNEIFTENFIECFTVKELQVLQLVATDESITAQAMADTLGVTKRTIANRLKSLKDKNVIERIGSDTKGSWRIIDTEERR